MFNRTRRSSGLKDEKYPVSFGPGIYKSTQVNYDDFDQGGTTNPGFNDEVTYIECIRSSTLPNEEDYKYYERQVRSDWTVTDDAGGTVNPGADVHDLGAPGYYREGQDNRQVEFKEISHTHARGRTGSYVFLAVNRNNPLYPTLKAAHLRRKDFDDNATYAFGGVLILLGIICLIVGCVSIGIKAYFYYVGTGIWCGVILIICGVCAIRASHNIFLGSSNLMLYTGLAFATLGIFSCLILLILAIIGIMYDYTGTTLSTASTTSSAEGAIFVHILHIVIGVAGLVACIILVLVVGKYAYRRHHYTMVPNSLIKSQYGMDPQNLNDMNRNTHTESDRLDSTTKFTNPTISVIEQNPLYSSSYGNNYSPPKNGINKNKVGPDYKEDDITIGMDIRT